MADDEKIDGDGGETKIAEYLIQSNLKAEPPAAPLYRILQQRTIGTPQQ